VKHPVRPTAGARPPSTDGAQLSGTREHASAQRTNRKPWEGNSIRASPSGYIDAHPAFDAAAATARP
jgi:hypothetical protein